MLDNDTFDAIVVSLSSMPSNARRRYIVRHVLSRCSGQKLRFGELPDGYLFEVGRRSVIIPL